MTFSEFLQNRETGFFFNLFILLKSMIHDADDPTRVYEVCAMCITWVQPHSALESGQLRLIKALISQHKTGVWGGTFQKVGGFFMVAGVFQIAI